ncbi:MAG: hypothetical protein E6Q97_37180 [Desulfurellales bacterium]|nr:MAG: hypothetical protein E6Q97_37180 [Desulfurellales bacterium]
MTVNQTILDDVIKNAHNIAFAERSVMDRAAAQFVTFDTSSPEALEASVREFVRRSIANLQQDLERVYTSSRRKATAMLRRHIPIVVKEAVVSIGVIGPPSLDKSKKVVKSLFRKDSYAQKASLIASPEARERFTAQQIAKAKEVLAKGLAKGAVPSAIADSLRATVASPHNWARIARTEVQRVNNLALKDSYEANSDLIAGQQFVATLDTRTCPVCQAYDGEVYYEKPTSGQKSLADAPEVPVHPQCRCTFAPVLKSVAEIEQATGIQPGLLPKSLDGKATQKLNYDEWIKTQDKETQQAALGERYDAYKKGVTLKQMVVGDRALDPEELDEIEVGKIAKVKPVKIVKGVETVGSLASTQLAPVTVSKTIPKIAKAQAVITKTRKVKPVVKTVKRRDELPSSNETRPWDQSRATSIGQWKRQLTAKQESSIRKWTGKDYFEFRKTDKTGSGKYKRELDEIKEALKKAPIHKGVVFRGMQNLYTKDFDNLGKIGAKVKLDSLSSFAKSQASAARFAKSGLKAILEVKTRRGYDISSLSTFTHEKEVLLMKKTVLVVKKVKKQTSNLVHVILEEVSVGEI